LHGRKYKCFTAKKQTLSAFSRRNAAQKCGIYPTQSKLSFCFHAVIRKSALCQTANLLLRDLLRFRTCGGLTGEAGGAPHNQAV
jgi:hypothetical protein